MFKIHVYVPDKYIEDAKNSDGVVQSSELFGEIYISIGNFNYPLFKWVDFADMLISSWHAQLRNFLENSIRVDMPFMRGPYKFSVERKSDSTLSLQFFSFDENGWKCIRNEEIEGKELIDEFTKAKKLIESKINKVAL